MNKQELVNAVASAARETKTLTATAVDDFIDVVTRALVKGETAQLIGFGSFGTGSRTARTGRNPATEEAIEIAAATAVKLTAGKAFKDLVNS
jgi:DNA-binding protein HU-beta